MSTKINSIMEELKSLTLMEAAELVKQIEVVFGVDATSVSAPNVQMITGNQDTNLKDVEEQTEFTVVLEEVPSVKKIAILKVVRSITGLGLKDAKNLVESCPKMIKENIAKEEADDIKRKLEDVGAKITIK